MLLLAAQVWLALTVVTGALLATVVLLQSAITVARQAGATVARHDAPRLPRVASSHG